MNPEPAVRDRVAALPDAMWDCERCGSIDSMMIRRSSLNEQFHADDVMLKCGVCWFTPTHGIPFEDQSVFREEWDNRDSRVHDFAQDAANPKERLAALGYLSKSEVE